ncbi:MAG: hypothetical protein M5U34_48440 [Chloroflexi bacterium]|nr:hypothetical protein [Chloroflexota bacterium]
MSLGITSELNTFGQLVIAFVMFWGRLGRSPSLSPSSNAVRGTVGEVSRSDHFDWVSKCPNIFPLPRPKIC